MKSKSLLGAVLSVASVVSLSACQSRSSNLEIEPILSNRSHVIYGEDDRSDLHSVKDPFWLQRADSTVALMRTSKLIDNGDGTTRIDGTRFGDANMLCEGEPFIDQKKAAFCSGFLVAADTVVTAGHCIRTAADCDNTRFVFGFAIRADGQQPESVPTSEIYSCKTIVRTVANPFGTDLAVIKLDRAVENHAPLALRQSGSLAKGDALVVIGHPAGLPLKVADNASVRSVQADFIVANLDTYGGNSGSAVFNAQTGEVEGILVRGENDFEWKNGCYVSKRCADDGCRGEDVTKISKVLPYLNGTAVPTDDDGGVADEPALPDLGSEEFLSGGAVLAIPDGLWQLESSIHVDSRPLGRAVQVSVHIEHPYRGDLEISLVAPDGRVVVLKSQSFFDSEDHVIGTYGVDLVPAQDLRPLSTVNATGRWTLRVRDLMASDAGVLVGWKLAFIGASDASGE